MAMIFLRIGAAAVTAVIALSGLVFVLAAAAENDAPRATIWTIPDIAALPDDDHGRRVRQGRDLVTATYAHIGPQMPDPAERYAGNNLACGNCHLEAGTKKYGLPIFGLYWDFPRYSARSGADMSIADRINSCMTRSMNGRPLPADAPEMQALIAYVKFLVIRRCARRAAARAWVGENARSRSRGGSKAWRVCLCAGLSRLP